MRELPILINGAMVPATQEGRKTVSQGIVQERVLISNVPTSHPAIAMDVVRRCPYGQPGDKKWMWVIKIRVLPQAMVA